MTLLVVLGVVVVATIVAALYLSLKSGRGDEPDPGDAETGNWQGPGREQVRQVAIAGRAGPVDDRPWQGRRTIPAPFRP